MNVAEMDCAENQRDTGQGRCNEGGNLPDIEIRTSWFSKDPARSIEVALFFVLIGTSLALAANTLLA